MKIKLPTRLYFTLCEYRALCFKEPRGCKSEGKTRCLQTLLSSSIFFLNPPAHVFFLDAQSGKFYKVSVSIAFTRLISILVGKLVCLLPDPSLQGALGAPERQLPCGPAPRITTFVITATLGTTKMGWCSCTWSLPLLCGFTVRRHQNSHSYPSASVLTLILNRRQPHFIENELKTQICGACRCQ